MGDCVIQKTRLSFALVAAGVIALLSMIFAMPATAAVPAAAGGGHIDISDGSARVVADLSFTSTHSFKLTNVTLYDVNCDGRSALFESYDDYGYLKVHTDSNGCNTSVHWSELDGDSGSNSKAITFVSLHTYACNSTSCSSGKWSANFFNPN
jgi:hypothetical protein